MKTSKRVMLILGIAIIIAFVVVCIWPSGGNSKMEFEPLDGQFALLERVYPQWFGERIEVMSDPDGKRVVCDYLSYKGMIASKVDGWEKRMDEFNADEMDYVVGTSIHADYWLSLAAFEALESFYQGNEVRQSEIVADCAEVDPDLKQNLVAEVASFKEVAQSEGFLDEAGNILPEKRKLVILLHRYQWISVSGNQLPIARIQPPEENLAVFRWQIEQSQLPFEKKVQRITKFRNMYPKDYDYDYAMAIILSQNGMVADACTYLHNGLANVSVEDTFRKNRYEHGLKLLSAQEPGACKR